MNIRFNLFGNYVQNNNNNNRNNEENDGALNQITRFFVQLFQRNDQPQAFNLNNEEDGLPRFNQFTEPPETLEELSEQLRQTSDRYSVIILQPEYNPLSLRRVNGFFNKLKNHPFYTERDLSHKLFYLFKYACRQNGQNQVFNHLPTCFSTIIGKSPRYPATTQIHEAMIAHKYYQIILEKSDEEQPKELVSLAKKMSLHELVYQKLEVRELTFDQYVLVYQNLQEQLKICVDIEQKPDIPNPLTDAEEKNLIDTINRTFKKTMAKLPCDSSLKHFGEYLKKRYPSFENKEKHLNKAETEALVEMYINKLCIEAGEEEELFGDIKNAAQTS